MNKYAPLKLILASVSILCLITSTYAGVVMQDSLSFDEDAIMRAEDEQDLRISLTDTTTQLQNIDIAAPAIEYQAPYSPSLQQMQEYPPEDERTTQTQSTNMPVSSNRSGEEIYPFADGMLYGAAISRQNSQPINYRVSTNLDAGSSEEVSRGLMNQNNFRNDFTRLFFGTYLKRYSANPLTKYDNPNSLLEPYLPSTTGTIKEQNYQNKLNEQAFSPFQPITDIPYGSSDKSLLPSSLGIQYDDIYTDYAWLNKGSMDYGMRGNYGADTNSITEEILKEEKERLRQKRF